MLACGTRLAEEGLALLFSAQLLHSVFVAGTHTPHVVPMGRSCAHTWSKYFYDVCQLAPRLSLSEKATAMLIHVANIQLASDFSAKEFSSVKEKLA